MVRWRSKLGIGRGYTGAVHVSEVEVDTLLGRIRVPRAAAGIAAGRVAAPELARSQCYGGVIQGVGYALYEQRQDDPQSGIVLSAGLEDYRIPGIGDTPEIEVHFDEEGFEHVPGGGVGLGEISTMGVAASIGNAVHNATGWRPYELPIRPDRLLEGMSSVTPAPSTIEEARQAAGEFRAGGTDLQQRLRSGVSSGPPVDLRPAARSRPRRVG